VEKLLFKNDFKGIGYNHIYDENEENSDIIDEN